MNKVDFVIHWKYGVHPLTSDVERVICNAIRNNLEGTLISSDDVGKKWNIDINTDGLRASVEVILDEISPSFSSKITEHTLIRLRQAQIKINSGALQNSNNDDSLDQDIKDLVTFNTVFSPLEKSHYIDVYNSLVGIPKDFVLQEIRTLIMSMAEKERWSHKHYDKVIPALKMNVNKAPVIILSGDPGTGKTAFATSVGAKLSQEIKEDVRFLHISLMLRGMGYQGRASSMVVKLFDAIKQNYINTKTPTLLFFDEADAVAGARGETDSSSGAQENIAIVNSIIVGVDNLRKGMQVRVVALFATNLSRRLDAALMRRSYFYEFHKPDEQSRQFLFENSLAGLNFSADDIKSFVHATSPKNNDGKLSQYSHSDIVELIVGRALNDAIINDTILTSSLILEYCKRTAPTMSV